MEILQIMGMETMNSVNPIFLLLASLAYCYFLVAKLIPKGIPRVLFLLPTFYIFSSVLPWHSSSSFLRGILSYFITWISSFKLLLFCFDRGPLSAVGNFPDFFAVTIFPVKLKLEDNNYKSLLFLSRYDVVPLFNRPYLATSLQDFWGRRWNLLSSSILRETIYLPTRNALKGVVGFLSAKVAALILTLAVSGIMHEIMFYYITCGKKPTWEVTQYFVLQAIAMVFEVALKKLFRVKGWNPVHPALSVVFTIGFVVATAYWKLVLPVERNVQNEYCGF
ncbi:acyl-CoA--sterol O-acyltransferase 1-like [Melia azedarach]|uniref:Acyl-CoA--sterol O-acyltransferase 1-like n=1 Tax=Melia azedarach TaxID=155640 RepID=A0ACC1WYD7_MELAZ|nr:acyl-CoA--sterol O-acyltransferase 1-like [Melia azedarach]